MLLHAKPMENFLERECKFKENSQDWKTFFVIKQNFLPFFTLPTEPQFDVIVFFIIII